jgi:hypothetical protein
MRTAPMPEVYDGAALDEELALRRREDGSYTVSALDAHDLLIGPDSFRHLAHLAADWRRRSWARPGFCRLHRRHYPDAWGTARSLGCG